MYNQDLINYFGEREIREYLETNNYKISFTTLDEDKIRLRNAIENYILKYRSNPNSTLEKRGMEYYLESLADVFASYPEIYSNSILLSKANAARVFTSAQLLKIQQTKSKLSSLARQLYEASKTRELNANEKHKLMNFFMGTINTDSESIKKAQEDYAKKILASDKIPENDSELKFILTYFHHKMLTSGTFGNSKKNVQCTIHLTDLGPNDGGYYSNNTIFVNRNSYNFCNTLPKLLECVCHETEHAIQDYESKHNPNSVVGFEYAINNLLYRHYKTEEYSPYKDNYRYSDIEKDAEEKGYRVASSIYYQFGYREKWQGLKDLKKDEFSRRAFEYEYIKDENGKRIPKEQYNVTHMNAIMQNHPEYMQQYPVLAQTYHQDGTVKSFEEMLATNIMVNDANYYKIYNDYLTYYIKNGQLDSLDIKNFKQEDKVNVLKHLIALFNNETDIVLAMADNENVQTVASGQRRVTSGYHLKLASKLSTFLVNNYQIIEEMTDSNELGPAFNVHCYKNDLEAILYHLSKYDKDDEFKENIQKYSGDFEQNYQEMHNTRNRLYIQKKLSEYDDETLSKKVALPNGVLISFEQYCEEYIFSRMNIHREFVSENGEIISVEKAMERALNRNNDLNIPANLTAEQIEELKELGYFEDKQEAQSYSSEGRSR